MLNPSSVPTSPVRILFVDDEETIRITLGEVLRVQGYEVTTVSTVAEALVQITSNPFDVLIADLNIGQPGDGFTVVSAMRSTQPYCATFILTAYPALETALQAIRSQVDDYLIKPTDVEALVRAIESRGQRKRVIQLPPKRIAMLIRENTAEISTKYLTAVKSHAELSQIRVSDQEWLDHLPGVLSDLVEMLESPPTESSERTMQSASQHGRVRRDQGYSVPMMIQEARIVSDVVFEIIQRNLMALDLSRLIADVRCMNDSLQAQLTASVAAYLTRNH